MERDVDEDKENAEVEGAPVVMFGSTTATNIEEGTKFKGFGILTWRIADGSVINKQRLPLSACDLFMYMWSHLLVSSFL